jgi:phage terminase large subunit
MIIALFMLLNFNTYLNPKHTALFQATDRELIVYGGAGAGKTYSIADKFLVLSCLTHPRQTKTVMVRKTLASLKRTSLDVLQRRAELFGLDLIVNRSEWTAKCNNMEFVLTGMNNREDYQKIKSLTDVDYIWVNELSELRESDYAELMLRLRGQPSHGKYDFRQIVCDFNPIGKTSWVFSRFFEKNVGNVKKLRYTVADNPWAETEYIEQLKASKGWDENYYRIYFEGEWGELEGLIFEWDIVPLPDLAFDEVFYGGDFGYSVDPATCIKIYRKANEYWVQEVIYETGLTNQQLGNRMKDEGITRNDQVFWDSAEPKSIQELCDMGLTAIPAIKGPDSVRAGIDFLKTLKIHIIEGSEKIIREAKSYVWKKDKDGNCLNEPKAFDDHAMAAIRYAIYTRMGGFRPQYTYKAY